MLNLERKELEKNYITLIYEDKENRVSWFADSDIEDVRFAILCACDSLVDGEFEVLDDKAKLKNLNTEKEFRSNSILFLRKKHNKPTNILLDGNRKLMVEIEPLRHIESQEAVKYMIIGSNLLKHCKEGFPHIRNFQVSSDLKRILWYTKSKSISEAQVAFDSIAQISSGQISDNFKRYPLKMLEEYSFSIFYYKNKSNEVSSLDITCKDEREFDLWMIGVKALHSHNTNKIINKYNLLYHSKSFLSQVEKGNIGVSSKFLFYENNEIKDKEKKLENFMISRNLDKFELAKLLITLCNKIKDLRNTVIELNEEEEIKTGEMKNDYDMVFAEEAIVDDLETQKNQMVKLFNESERSLSIHLQDFLNFFSLSKKNNSANLCKENEEEFTKLYVELEDLHEKYLSINLDCSVQRNFNDFFIRELDINLWKIEIDLENVSDIINRFKAPQNKGIIEKLKNIFKYFKK